MSTMPRIVVATSWLTIPPPANAIARGRVDLLRRRDWISPKPPLKPSPDGR
jgi:hypothetical protein